MSRRNNSDIVRDFTNQNRSANLVSAAGVTRSQVPNRISCHRRYGACIGRQPEGKEALQLSGVRGHRPEAGTVNSEVLPSYRGRKECRGERSSIRFAELCPCRGIGTGCRRGLQVSMRGAGNSIRRQVRRRANWRNRSSSSIPPITSSFVRTPSPRSRSGRGRTTGHMRTIKRRLRECGRRQLRMCSRLSRRRRR